MTEPLIIPNGPATGKNHSPPILGLFLLLLVFLPHVAWMMVPIFRPQAPVPSKPIRMAYLPGDASKVWSPVLFALPSSVGFSGAVRRDGAIVRPPLGEPIRLALRLDPLPPDVTPPVFGAKDGTGLPPISLAGPRPEPPMLGRQWNWSLEWLSPDGPRVQAFRPPQIGANPKPQRVEGILEVDEFGQVTHLILNPSATFPPDRREIVLALRALRVQRGQGPLRLRFRLSLEGREVAP